MALINIYKGTDITSGGTEGTLVSSGDNSNSIETGYIKIPASGFTESEWVKIGIRCTTGHKTILENSRHARVSITDSGDVTRWQLALDDSGSPSGSPSAYGSPLDFTSEIGSTNVIFWIRAKA